MSWKLAALGLGVAVLITSTVVWADPIERPELTKNESNYVAAYVLRMGKRGHFVLDASVTDEAGRPIPDFTVVYSWPFNEGGELKPDPALVDMTNKLVNARMELDSYNKWSCYKNGRFQLDLKYARFSFFDLHFLAEGYYESKVNLSDPRTKEEQKAELVAIINAVKSRSADLLPKEVLIKKKLSVVMRKKPKTATKLQRWNVDVKLTKKGERTLFQWVRDRRSPTRDEQVLPRAIFFTAEKDKDGSFRGLNLSPEDTDPEYRNIVPRGVKVGIKGAAGDGFLRYQPKSWASADKSIQYVPEPVRRGMGLAPEKGYLPEVSLSTEELRPDQDKGPMFYVKSHGLYGRAQFNGFNFYENQSVLILHFDVEWQPDGSRNLETGE